MTTAKLVQAIKAEQPPPRSSITPHVGLVVAGTYRLDRQIGAGASSQVFRAEHLRLSKAFAIKLLRHADSKAAIERFRRETRAVARVRSEHVVAVVDCGELDDQTPYLVMELLEGEDLRSLLSREGRLPTRRVVHLIIEACRGVVAAHASGLVHRDLKPENLFITSREDGRDWCKVLDFGVVKMDSMRGTAQGALLGTVRYMAPEQLADGASAGPASDVYALGAILYECLTGRPPHEGDAIHEVMFSIMNRTPPSLAELCPRLPASLTSLVERCLAKSSAARPGATELLRQLSEWLRTGAAATGVEATVAMEDDRLSPPPEGTTERSRRWWPLAAVALGITAAAVWLRPSAHVPAPVAGKVTTEARAAAPPAPVAPAKHATSAGTAPSAEAASPSGSSNAKVALRLGQPRFTAAPRIPPAPTSSGPAASGRLPLGLDTTNPYAE